MKLKKIGYSLVFWCFIITLYVVTRTIKLKVIPIFTDEAIYSYWAQVALHDPQHRFISLEDGKQPLFIWLAAILQRFISDPLIATRFVSVISGLGSLIGIYLLSRKLFNEQVAKLAMVLYIVLPFTLLYDRLALYDSLLTMLGIYAVYFSVLMVKKPDLGIALLNGFAIGLATITKSSGNFFLYLLPFSLILFEKKNLQRNIIRWIPLSILTAALSLVIYNSLRLSPLFYLIARKNLEFIRYPQKVIQNPLEYFFSNLTAIAGWLSTYLSLPLFIIFIFSTLFVIYRKNIKGFYLIIIISASLTAELLFNKILYTRFVLFYVPYIIILIAFGIYNLKKVLKVNEKIKVIIVIALFALPALNSIKIIYQPTSANIPKNDSDQYLNSWPAGYGVEEVIKFIKPQSANQTINIATEGTFGLMPYALNIYFYQNTNVQIHSFWPLNPDDLPEQIIQIAKKNKTYVIFYQTQKSINNPSFKHISSYRQGIGNSYLRLYEIIPQ